MEDLFLSADIGDSKRVWLSPISRRTYRDSVGSGLGGDRGYFVLEEDMCPATASVTVLAKASSYDAAIRLFEMLTAGSRTVAA
ncbi:MAG: hypothetical protein EOO77_37030 [Oxalobacteraceae bacterium]|nr:MAG: hypothetical protein EOO77_37030 [Oxalobacteraceae bacterium]